ncbi:MAG: anthranilate phosphoribosyltransferase [Deltaproteobacteria bacterium]|jgi:anthranilate synthase/phosphoribosyltransferase|nr:anthranilate phosphoribosyltransferase [Deltaproteobacteria bacterium]
MFLLVDNYDSFTYNLAQLFQTLGADPLVLRNDDPGILELAETGGLERVCVSPGPGHPLRAGRLMEFLELLARRDPPVPVLGVCLGHQALGEFAGSPVVRAARVMHGKVSRVVHSGEGIFAGLPRDMTGGRYHSLIVTDPGGRGAGRDPGPHPFRVTARSPEGEIMALSYEDLPWHGVQFHPESVLTPAGRALLDNFLRLPAARPGEPGEARPDGPEPAEPPATAFPLSAIYERVGCREDLGDAMAQQIFERLMGGELSPAQTGALLLGLRVKGETPVEVAAAATAVLRQAEKVPELPGKVLDVVGTGGDNRFSFNCSTGTALTCAALGYTVLKHGNRSVSSKSGSADVLERLGFDIEIPPERVAREAADRKFVFLFAPHYHPAFKHVMPVRRELGVRTLFNILGPLVNPARPTHRLIGVYEPGLLDLMAGALARLGGTAAAVVHGAGGYDELTPMGPAQVRLVRGAEVEVLALDPLEYGFAPCAPEELSVSGPVESAEVLRELLSGRGPKPMREMLAFNVGLALYLLEGGRMKDRMDEAKAAVSRGAAAPILPPLTSLPPASAS